MNSSQYNKKRRMEREEQEQFKWQKEKQKIVEEESEMMYFEEYTEEELKRIKIWLAEEDTDCFEYCHSPEVMSRCSVPDELDRTE